MEYKVMAMMIDFLILSSYLVLFGFVFYIFDLILVCKTWFIIMLLLFSFGCLITAC